MLEVIFHRDSRHRLSSIVARGHAQTGAYGEDVVCAAVSALLQAAWAGLTDVALVAVEGRREAGVLEMRWPAPVRDRADVNAIVATAELAIEQIARQEPRALRVSRATEPEE